MSAAEEWLRQHRASGEISDASKWVVVPADRKGTCRIVRQEDAGSSIAARFRRWWRGRGNPVYASAYRGPR